jgi:integrase
LNFTPKQGPNKGQHFRLSLSEHVDQPIIGRTEAEHAADRIKIAIREGRFGARLPARVTLTLGQLLAAYLKEYVTLERPRSLDNVRYQVGAIAATVLELPTGERRPFGEWLVLDLGTGALEKFRAARRSQTMVTVTDQDGQERTRRKGGVPTTNRDLALLRAAFNWGIRLDYVDTTPFKKSTETVVKLTKEASRRRRLEGDEGARLLAACDPVLRNPKTKAPYLLQPQPRLRPIVEALLETGCRIGELLSLQWSQVKDLAGRNPRLDLTASKTKTKRDRVVPISGRLQAILEMRRNDSAGEPHSPLAYVFGNEVGERTWSIKKAWRLTCGRAGIVGLRIHDLRREAGSRWIEGGVPLQVVRDWLGHANISQTSTYLESTLTGQHDAMRRFDAARAIHPARQTVPEGVQIVCKESSITGGEGASPGPAGDGSSTGIPKESIS